MSTMLVKSMYIACVCGDQVGGKKTEVVKEALRLLLLPLTVSVCWFLRFYPPILVLPRCFFTKEGGEYKKTAVVTASLFSSPIWFLAAALLVLAVFIS